MNDKGMTTADWLRAYAGWVANRQFEMLDADFLEGAADELEGRSEKRDGEND